MEHEPELSAIEIPSGRTLGGRIEVPPSKSVTHRVLLLSLLSDRALTVERPLVADDTERLVEALSACGRRVSRRGERLEIEVGSPASATDAVAIDCGSSGTLLRLLAGVVATQPGRWVLDGTAQLRSRPLGPLVGALRDLGVDVEFLGRSPGAPIGVTGGVCRGGRVRLDAGLSSQFLSALILLGLRCEEPLEVEVATLVSAPYVELTLAWVRRFGGRVDVEDGVYRVVPGLAPPDRVAVEADYSSAAYFAAAAALTGGRVELSGLETGSAQGDRRFFELLPNLGARCEWAGERLLVEGNGELVGIDVDMGDIPDQVPTLAALAPWARGMTRITGVPHVRVKESDRLSAMARELRRAGAVVTERDEGLEIPGIWAGSAPPAEPISLATHADHRIAMSLAVLGLRRPGVTVERPRVVAKSFPGFWRLFLGALAR